MGKLQTEVLELESKVEKDTTRLLRENRTPTFAVRLAERAQKETDRISDEALSRGVQFDCRKGCTYCCRLEVNAYPQESFRIARTLRERPNLELLIAALADHAEKNREVTDKRQRDNCPFLVDQACSIYEIRPIMCRRMHSLDVERCKQMSETVPSDPELFYKSEAIWEGTRKAYARVKLPTQAHELVGSVLLALTDPSAEERWWKGEDVFEINSRVPKSPSRSSEA